MLKGKGAVVIKKEKEFWTVVCEKCDTPFNATPDYVMRQQKNGEPLICTACRRAEHDAATKLLIEEEKKNRQPLTAAQKMDIIIYIVIAAIIAILAAMLAFVWPSRWSPLRVFPIAIALAAIAVSVTQIKDIRSGHLPFWRKKRV